MFSIGHFFEMSEMHVPPVVLLKMYIVSKWDGVMTDLVLFMAFQSSEARHSFCSFCPTKHQTLICDEATMYLGRKGKGSGTY